MAPFPHPITIGLAVIPVIGTLVSLYEFFKPDSDVMADKNIRLTQAVIGHDVQNSGQGVGEEIVNTGGGIGGEVHVTAPAGTSVIGTRVIQNGPGIGMRVINSGQGVGFRSTVVVGPKE